VHGDFGYDLVEVSHAHASQIIECSRHPAVLATALRLNARAMVVYDTELRAASRTASIDAFSPGAS
jgi:hypothetical protein